MIHCIKTDSNHEHFRQLAAELEADLKMRDGDDHLFNFNLNKIDYLQHVLIAYDGQLPVGCGAIRPYSVTAIEIKRMFTIPEKRGIGIASFILKNLEEWARQLHYKICVLETGLNQPEAISFYQKNNYTHIPNFGPYQGSANSTCFEKQLVP